MLGVGVGAGGWGGVAMGSGSPPPIQETDPALGEKKKSRAIFCRGYSSPCVSVLVSCCFMRLTRRSLPVLFQAPPLSLRPRNRTSHDLVIIVHHNTGRTLPYLSVHAQLHTRIVALSFSYKLSLLGVVVYGQTPFGNMPLPSPIP